MENLKVGVVGLGAIGERLIQGFTTNEKTTVVAVVDTDTNRASAMADRLGGIRWYDSHLDMLEKEELDIVYVAVPPKYHHKITIDVIEKGIHVLCEKPLANSLVEAKDMLVKAEEAGIIHAMNFPLNYSAPANQFEKLVNEGYIGKVRRIELSMNFPQWPRAWQKNEWVAGREQGGFVLEVGVHFFQLTQRIFGSITHQTTQLELSADPAKCETGIFATLELADGTPFIINGLSQIAGQERIAYTAYGTEGTLSLVNWSQLEGGKLGQDIKPIEAENEETSSLLTNLVDAISGKESTLYDFRAGYDAQIILEKVRNNE